MGSTARVQAYHLLKSKTRTDWHSTNDWNFFTTNHLAEFNLLPPPTTPGFSVWSALAGKLNVALQLLSNGHWPEISPKIQRRHYSSKILWQGNPLSTVKTFETNHCMLCNRERLEIFKRNNKEPKSLINSHNEIFGGCHHKPHFHRYCRKTTSADDSTKDEKVNSTTTTEV